MWQIKEKAFLAYATESIGYLSAEDISPPMLWRRFFYMTPDILN
jgi:hypothetical protein